MAETLTSLADTIRGSSFVSGLEGEEQDGGGKRLDHAFEGAPALPPKWTYPPPPHVSCLAALHFDAIIPNPTHTSR